MEILTTLGEEAQEKSHSWARCLAQRTDLKLIWKSGVQATQEEPGVDGTLRGPPTQMYLKFEHPEALEPLRSKFAEWATGLVKWLDGYRVKRFTLLAEWNRRKEPSRESNDWYCYGFCPICPKLIVWRIWTIAKILSKVVFA
jgi:hypothetical protein